MVLTMTPSRFFSAFMLGFAALGSVNAYWLMSTGIISTERLDPIVSPGKVAGHVHSIMGGSNFGFTTTTAQLRQSKCTSTPIRQDKSNYWFPHLYFQWANGSVTSLSGGSVVYYLFSNDRKTTAFPDDFRMISGDPTLRTYNASSHAQQAVTFLCLNFNGVSTRHNAIPSHSCPSGVRAQINMPSCWDGKNVDSPNHISHVAFPSGGPDSGTCSDPRYPVTLPRIFIEMYWNTAEFDKHRSAAMDTAQPFVFSYGDRTGYGYHADFFNGWDAGVLQRAVDHCNCNKDGDPTCCAQAGIFDFNPKGNPCFITPQVDEVATGTLAKLPGNNPVQGAQDSVNGHVVSHPDPSPPGALYPPAAYTDKPDAGACAVGGKMGNKCSRRAVPGGAPPVSAGPAPSAPSAPSAPASSVPASVSTTAPIASSPLASPSSVHAVPTSHVPSSSPPSSPAAPVPSASSPHGSNSTPGHSSPNPGHSSSGHPNSGHSNSAHLNPGHSSAPYSKPGYSNPAHSSTGHLNAHPNVGHSKPGHLSSGNHSGTCRKSSKHAGKHRRRNIH